MKALRIAIRRLPDQEVGGLGPGDTKQSAGEEGESQAVNRLSEKTNHEIRYWRVCNFAILFGSVMNCGDHLEVIFRDGQDPEPFWRALDERSLAEGFKRRLRLWW